MGAYGLSTSEAQEIAKGVVEEHRRGREAAFQRMLTAQKYAFHVSGEGDAQWADIVNGQQVRIPRRRKGALRHQDNILRPMVNYWIAYFTSQPLRTVAEHRADRKSQDRARIDSLVGNLHLQTQKINDVSAAAMWMAAFNGWGITHSMWRNDIVQSGLETPSGYDPEKPQRRVVYPGFTDVFPGNPFDTFFAPSSTRFSIPSYTYGRSLPTELVKSAFPEAPGIENLVGSDREPSTSWMQRVLRLWESLSGGRTTAHGTAALTVGRGTEDILGLVCKEILPGQDRAFPKGLLVVVGLKGASDTGGTEGPQGEAQLLHIGPLPGGIPSGTVFYALPQGDDPYGKAYVADLDDDQVRLNQAITMFAEMLSQLAYPQLFVPQGTQLLANQTLGDKIIEYIHNAGSPPPQYQFPGTGANFGTLLSFIQDIRESAFRKGGWQASSRGEASGANEPTSRAQFLAAQDKMIFAPTAMAFRSSIIQILRKNHALRNRYQTLPLLVEALGEDLKYSAEEYIHKQDMSPSPPNFSLVSGFGASAEERLGELNTLLPLRDGENTAVLPAKRYWELHPDPSLRPNEPSADDARRRRAHAINVWIETIVEEFRAAVPDAPPRGTPEIVQQISQVVFEKYPPEWTDALAFSLFIEALDSLVQDPSIDPLVGAVASDRQRYLLQWQTQASGQMQQPAEEAPAGAGAETA